MPLSQNEPVTTPAPDRPRRRVPRLRLPPPPPLRRLWLAVAIILLVDAALWHRCGLAGCPAVARLSAYQPGRAPVLLDRAGHPFGQLTPVDHVMVRLDSLPAYVPAAFVAVEDRRFYRHHGVDWLRVAGAALANLRAGHAVQGSSTITMQLARNLFPKRIRADEKTLRRKLLEVRVAQLIERRFSKQEILELYLNHIYFGAGAFGIESAAREYFGRSARSLSLPQAAMLAALPKAPSHYDPRRQPRRARERRDLVLALMERQGRISPKQADRARTLPLDAVDGDAPRGRGPGVAPYFAAVVRQLLEDRLDQNLYDRPLRIYTTLDRTDQRVAEQELDRELRRVENGAYGRFRGPRYRAGAAPRPQTGYLQGAVVVMDVATGDVRALVGGRDYAQSHFDRATEAHRQAGSAFKPFVYAAALQAGYAPSSRLSDTPYRLASSGGKPWEPRNFDGQFYGDLSLRDALVYSRNVPTVRLAADIGVGSIARVAHAAGVQEDIRPSPMVALGITEVSPLELTAAYTAFADGGVAVQPRFVTRVEDDQGNVLWAPEVVRNRALDPGTAYIMTDMMEDVVDQGTGRNVRNAGYGGPAAGKTGTTNEGTDNWFVGYTPTLIAGVWVGFDTPRTIAPRATGGSVTAAAWGHIMSRIAAGSGRWTRPADIVELPIDPTTGLALEEGCSPVDGAPTREIFTRGHEPDTSCPERVDGNRSGPARWFGRALSWLGSVFTRDRDDAQPARPAPSRPVAPSQPQWRSPPSASRGVDAAQRERLERLQRRLEHMADALERADRRRRQRELDQAARQLENLVREARRHHGEISPADLAQARAWLRNLVESTAREARARRDDRQRVLSWLQNAAGTLARSGVLGTDEGEQVMDWIEDASDQLDELLDSLDEASSDASEDLSSPDYQRALPPWLERSVRIR